MLIKSIFSIALLMSSFATYAFNLEVKNYTSVKLYASRSKWNACQYIDPHAIGILLDAFVNVKFYDTPNCDGHGLAEVTINPEHGIQDMKIYSDKYLFAAYGFKVGISPTE